MISARNEGGFPQPRPKCPLNADYVKGLGETVNEACAMILDRGWPELLFVFNYDAESLETLVISGATDFWGTFFPDTLTLSLDSRAIPCRLDYTRTVFAADPMDPPVETALFFEFDRFTPSLTLTGSETTSYAGFILSRRF